ncbi:hypothetical protein RHGRI_038926 [Rhododendron griersonianum]|uniref:Phospholipid:diacylglycerol acyltransferase n=1 Tax=Rhododendron griersonianum TaxID=479676 RepID=A0AAV6HLC1_9ERIC|nr:hypothetical protein RHGRI_038926 [Rhododendron griersonianum]
MYMAAYDWRISFQNAEVRDQTLSRIKSNIELMVATNGGNKAVIIPHSMGVLYFVHFMKWVEAPAPMGGGGGPDWYTRHIKAVMNIGGPFLGVPKAVSGLFSAEARDIAIARHALRKMKCLKLASENDEFLKLASENDERLKLASENNEVLEIGFKE